MREDLYAALRDAIEEERPAASATVVDGEHIGGQLVLVHPDSVHGSLGSQDLDQAAVEHMRGMLRDGGAGAEQIAGERVFLEAHLPPPHLLIIGAVHIAIPLVGIAKIMGFKTTAIDARGIFATDERFPHVDRLIEAWPDEALEEFNLHPGVAAVILAHDEKFEDPALEVLLKSDVGYIGAIGSRKTSEERLVRLRGYGFTSDDLARIHGPIGLDLGGRSPEEIALSIMAEIVAVRNGKDPRQATAAAKST